MVILKVPNVMENTSIIEEFRKLERELGKKSADALMQFLLKYNELLLNQVASKADVTALHSEMHKEIGGVKDKIGNMSWKIAAFLIAQAALVVTLMKLL